MFPDEVYGMEALRIVGQIFYGDLDPAAVITPADSVRVRGADASGPDRLEVDLPFVSKDQIEVIREAGTLALRVGTFQRRLPLPPLLASRPMAEAKLENGMLTVRFLPGEPLRETSTINATVP